MLQQQIGLYRNPPEVSMRDGKYLIMGGRRVVNFASNDYLGLSVSDEFAAASGAPFSKVWNIFFVVAFSIRELCGNQRGRNSVRIIFRL